MTVPRPEAAEAAAPADPLLSRCVAGDRQAWRTLHREQYPVALAFLRKLGVRGEEAEDACQEVFVQILRYLPGFEGRSEFRTWLYRLCATQADRVRRRHRLAEALRFWARQERADAGIVGLELSDAEARRRVQGALERMKPQHRLVFVLYEMEGLAGREIAAISGCPEATVWRRLHYARKEFAALLEEDGCRDAAG